MLCRPSISTKLLQKRHKRPACELVRPGPITRRIFNGDCSADLRNEDDPKHQMSAGSNAGVLFAWSAVCKANDLPHHDVRLDGPVWTLIDLEAVACHTDLSAKSFGRAWTWVLRRWSGCSAHIEDGRVEPPKSSCASPEYAARRQRLLKLLQGRLLRRLRPELVVRWRSSGPKRLTRLRKGMSKRRLWEGWLQEGGNCQ